MSRQAGVCAVACWKIENQQVSYRICARICARDAVGRVETGETRKFDTDPRLLSAEVNAAIGDGPRRRRPALYAS